MSKQDISLVLELIEKWAYQELGDERLGEECRVSGASFFDFMTQQGIYPGTLARKIQRVTGINPRQLYKSSDAALLRDAIFRYEASIFTTRAGEMTAEQSVNHFWS